jgi:hypothetical protein
VPWCRAPHRRTYRRRDGLVAKGEVEVFDLADEADASEWITS